MSTPTDTTPDPLVVRASAGGVAALPGTGATSFAGWPRVSAG